MHAAYIHAGEGPGALNAALPQRHRRAVAQLALRLAVPSRPTAVPPPLPPPVLPPVLPLRKVFPFFVPLDLFAPKSKAFNLGVNDPTTTPKLMSEVFAMKDPEVGNWAVFQLQVVRMAPSLGKVSEQHIKLARFPLPALYLSFACPYERPFFGFPKFDSADKIRRGEGRAPNACFFSGSGTSPFLAVRGCKTCA